MDAAAARGVTQSPAGHHLPPGPGQPLDWLLALRRPPSDLGRIQREDELVQGPRRGLCRRLSRSDSGSATLGTEAGVAGPPSREG